MQDNQVPGSASHSPDDFSEHISRSLGTDAAEGLASDEIKKRKREKIAIVGLCLLFFLLFWIETQFFDVGKQLPLGHSILFLGLVNFNVFIVLLLFFLIFRNLAKVFVEKQGKVIGSSLKGKLILAFITFGVLPSSLVLLVSIFYINSSFDRWFNVKMVSVLKNSLEVTNAYYISSKQRNYHFAHQIADRIAREGTKRQIKSQLNRAINEFSLDAVEYYPGLFSERVLSQVENATVPQIPRASMEFLKKGLEQRNDASTIHYFREGNLVRVIVPVNSSRNHGAVIVSTFVPLSLISRMNEISAAYEDFKDINPLEYPIKSIYLMILILMTSVIVMCVTWFGIRLARHLTIPLEKLGLATQQVAKGHYTPVETITGSVEMNRLINNFNKMIQNLATSEAQVNRANQDLHATLQRLDEHSKYIEVVLKRVNTGVISVDQEDRITTINQHASELLKIEVASYLGRQLSDILREPHYALYLELLRVMKKHKADSIQKEIRIDVQGKPIPMQMSLSLLYDQQQNEIGRVLVFDDLTMLMNAQRAAAWTEVARRIAHEIKNPLTPIKLSAQRLQKKFGEQVNDQVFDECTKMIIDQTDELKDLVNEFSQFARLPQTRPVIGSLNKVIEEAMIIFRTAHKDCSFETVLDPTLPEFKFDSEQIKRVIVNLVDNAISAVKVASVQLVTVRTDYDNLLKIARISVIDNGIGIPESGRERIFEPYFSTKEHGTGLGLAIVKRIVEDHNGFVRAFSNEPKGSRIVIELPVVEAPNRMGMSLKEGDIYG